VDRKELLEILAKDKNPNQIYINYAKYIKITQCREKGEEYSE